jgi:hypothetical protein
MTKDQIQSLIEKSFAEIKLEIAQAKTEIAESRLRHLTLVGTILVGLLGVVIPLWLTGANTSRVDSAITEMNAKFDKLALSQLRQPDIYCLGNGVPLDNSTVTLDPQTQDFTLELINSGSSSAYNVEVFLYFDTKDSIIVSNWNIGWFPHQISDDPLFARQVEYSSSAQHFNAKRTWALKTKIQILRSGKLTIPAKLKVFSMNAGPWEFRFTLVRN